MDLRVLQIFKAVVDEGGVARAAERLHCVQSNVSIRIRQLEDMLGTPLFERAGKRLTVTPRGIVLHGYAVRLLQLAEEARQMVKGSGEPCAELRFGACASTAMLQLPHVLTEFRRTHPAIQLHVNVATTGRMVQDVLGRHLDIGVVVDPISHPDLQQVEIYEDRLFLLTAPSHPSIRSAKDLHSTAIIVFREGCSYRNRMLGWLSEAGVPVSRMLEFDTIEAILGCVAAGLGATIMPGALVEKLDFTDEIQCHPLPDKYSRAKMVMIWRADSRHSVNPLTLAESFRTHSAPAFGRSLATSIAACDT